MTGADHWLSSVPTHWTHGRLKNLIATSANGTWGSDPIEGGPNVRCVRAADFDRVSRRAELSNAPLRYVEPSSLRQHLLRPGDLVLEKSGGGEKQPVGMAVLFTGVEAAVSSNFCARIKPYADVDSRFLTYVFAAAYGLGLTQAATKQTTGIQNLDTRAFFASRWAFPEKEEQRRIADFLDAETARMDRLGSRLQRFDRDVREREAAVLSNLLNAGASDIEAELPRGWSWTPLMHLTDTLRQIMYGIVLPGPNVTDGVPIVKGGDVAANRLSLEALNRTTHEIEAGYARSRLKGGDLVIAIRGSVGEVAVVPDELTGANLTQDAARISVGATTNANWLRLVLQSPVVEFQIKQRITGATIKGINIWDLKRISVPTPEPSEQHALAREAGKAIATHEALRSRVKRHQALLAERRQALITAAVTGQFDVTTASGRNVTEGVSV